MYLYLPSHMLLEFFRRVRTRYDARLGD